MPTIFLALLLAVPAIATATPLDVVNDVRRNGCGRDPLPALVHSARLDEAARRVARGRPLHDALPQSGYRANEAALLRVTNAPGERALRRGLIAEYCDDLRNPGVTEAGFFRAGTDLWVVFAAPFTPPPVGEASVVAQRALDLVNAARAQPRACGERQFGAATPLQLSTTLSEAALEHSREMAAGAPFAHQSAATGSPGDRVARTGYRAAIVGENIAAGAEDVDDVIGGLLHSPGHCANIMDPRFAETGFAFATNPETREGVFWTQVFATALPR